MELSKRGAAFIRRHEGFVPKWYLDPVNVPTIGIGFTWRSESFRKWWSTHKPGVAFARGATMTRAEAEDALRYICAAEYGAAVNRFLGKTVAQHVFDGMTSPVYNLGAGALEWRWAAAAKAGDLAEAAERLRNTGTTAKGTKLGGLVKRRKEEARLLQHGDYGDMESTEMVADTDPLADGKLVRRERGAPVLKLQQDLAKLGHYDGAFDGIFGHGTEAAVLEFQRKAGLVPDGFAGPLTLAQIDAALRKAPADKPAMREPDPTDALAPAPERPNWVALILRLIAAIFGRKP